MNEKVVEFLVRFLCYFLTLILLNCLLCYLTNFGNENFSNPESSFSDVRTESWLMLQGSLGELKEPQLVRIFLTNQGDLYSDLKKLFQESGTSHLLAISGGQLGPVRAAFCYFIGLVSFLFAHLFDISPWATQSFHHKIFPFVMLPVFGYLSVLFGSTGALWRLFFFATLYELVLTSGVLKFFPMPLLGTFGPFFIARCVILFVYFWTFGNPFLNLSFLLSGFGASISQVFTSLYSLAKKRSGFLMRSAVASFFVETFGTTLLISLALFPIQPVNLGRSLCANFIGSFVVNFFVTPTSLLVLLLSKIGWDFFWPLQILDNALHLLVMGLRGISEFGEGNPSETSSQLYRIKRPNLLFTHYGKMYLGAVCLMFWAIQDALKSTQHSVWKRE